MARPWGPLDGIPYTAKDSYLVRGATAASGSRPSSTCWRCVTPSRSSGCGKGAICLSKTNMPPMANGGIQRGVYGRAEAPTTPIT